MSLEQQISDQMLSDNSILFRVQQHDFVALTSQSRSVSARFGQQMEKKAVEFDYEESMGYRPFDPVSGAFMLQSERVKNNGITVNESFLLSLLQQNGNTK
jgi:hypothetical protein